MSIEMLVFLEKKRLPSRESWQEAIESLGFPMQLHPAVDAINSSGFSPCVIRGVQSGFEICSGAAEATLQNQAELTEIVGNQDWCISFRWRGDLNKCACAMAASAGLIKLCDAVAYFPDGNFVYDLNHLLEDFRACLKVADSAF